MTHTNLLYDVAQEMLEEATEAGTRIAVSNCWGTWDIHPNDSIESIVEVLEQAECEAI